MPCSLRAQDCCSVPKSSTSSFTSHNFQSLSKSKPHLHCLFPRLKAARTQKFLYATRVATVRISQENCNGFPRSSSEPNGDGGVKELEEFSEEWRRKKIGWLCKELPAHDPGPMVRLLKKQRKWIKQEDLTYIISHLLRIRENNVSHRVYKWMIQQDWFEFDLSLATKLADFLAKDLKIVRCRDVFDDIINRGFVPCETTFIMLIMAYIEAPVQGSVDEACNIYNTMIQFGGYQPDPTLRSSLFKALLRGTGGTAKHYLKQAETVFQNMQAAGYRIKSEIYEGLIWLHSYQDCINCERIRFLRNEMHRLGIKESGDLLVSILRVCSRFADVGEAERAWAKLLGNSDNLNSKAFVYRMEVYAKAGQHIKCLEIFKEMDEKGVPVSVIAYEKIIEVMSKAEEIEHAENFMKQFEDSGLKSLQSSYVNLMQMYMSLSIHNKVESTFSHSMTKCRPKRIAYDIYLESLIKCGKLDKAEEVLAGIGKDGAMGIKSKAYNIMLEGYLNTGQEEKIRRLYDEMCRKKYDVKPSLMQLIKPYTNLGNDEINKNLGLMLSAEQREIMIGILLCGAMLESHDDKKTFELHFEFNQEIELHDTLKTHLYDTFFEWLKPKDRLNVEAEEIPLHFSTISHRSLRFYADHFRPEGKMVIPRLIHRWLTPRTLAYWYMYGGRKSKSGDIVFYGNGYGVEEGESIAKAFKAKSINCVIKRRGKLFQVRCQGMDAKCTWKLIEQHILDNLKDTLRPEARVIEDESGTEDTNFYSEDEYNKENSGASSDSDFLNEVEEVETQSTFFT